jgi:hypothetical protein
MSNLFLDLWQDLREKRLWPVAAGLLLALVAVPFVLVKPAKEAPAAAGAGAAAAGAKPLQPIGEGLLKPAENSVSDGSALKAFLSKDPFKPIKELQNEAGVAPTTLTSTGAAGSASAGAGGSSTAGAAAGGSTGSPSSGGSTGGSTGGGTSGGGTTTTIKTWTYVADLHFGVTGHEKAYKRTKQLTVIPDEKTPLLVFLGVTSDRAKAVFLVDSKLQTSGEGRCKPSTAECTFLYLAQDADNNEQVFTDEDGTEYTLRLDDLRKLDLDKGGSSGDQKGSSGKSPSPVANGSRSTFGRGARSFGFPLFGSSQQTTVQTTGSGSSVGPTIR